MNGRFDRKTFVKTLGAGGLGLGVTFASGGTRSVLAHDRATRGGPSSECGAGPFHEGIQMGDEGMQMGGERMPMGGEHMPMHMQDQGMPMAMHDERMPMHDEGMHMHGAFYQYFTAALADELGGPNADEVDAAIRKAIMSLIDAHQSGGVLTYGQAEALKLLVATSDAPVAPGPICAVLFEDVGVGGPASGMGQEGMEGARQPGKEGMEEGGGKPDYEGMEGAGEHDHEGIPGGAGEPGTEGEDRGAMLPDEGGLETGLWQSGQEGSRRDKKRARKARRVRFR